MSKSIFVRVRPKTQESFFRCGMQFSKKWRRVEVDASTQRRLEQEQMLEVSETKPDDYQDEVSAGDSAAASSATGNGSGTPADAPPTDPAVRLAAIREAISQLDATDPAFFTAANKPKTESIAAITGWPVTAAERDAALEEVK
jgi:hypothetical protein